MRDARYPRARVGGMGTGGGRWVGGGGGGVVMVGEADYPAVRR